MKKKNKLKKINSVKGMNDILPSDSGIWRIFIDLLINIFNSYGYKYICTPILEYSKLFTQGIGENTDIVEKEMYSFIDKLNGDNLTLRPENTTSIIRSVIEHNLLYNGPKRLYYTGPMFRHERPQFGRYRQFNQIGVEAIGLSGPDIDAEIILICQRLWKKINLTNIHLELNSIGLLHERIKYRKDLILYLNKYYDLLDENTKQRLYTNPLRILDTKIPVLQNIIKKAPKILDYLGKESLDHFMELQDILKKHNVLFKINHRLVRGLDYYNLTVFEWITNDLGTQNTIVGGGRYDALAEKLGGKAIAACGFAIGVERIFKLIKKNNLIEESKNYDIYIIHKGELANKQAFSIAENLRNNGLNAILHCKNFNNETSSFRSQMKQANKSGAMFAVIIGNKEVLNKTVSIKFLRKCFSKEEEYKQKIIKLEHLSYFIRKNISLYKKNKYSDF